MGRDYNIVIYEPPIWQESLHLNLHLACEAQFRSHKYTSGAGNYFLSTNNFLISFVNNKLYESLTKV